MWLANLDACLIVAYKVASLMNECPVESSHLSDTKSYGASGFS